MQTWTLGTCCRWMLLQMHTQTQTHTLTLTHTHTHPHTHTRMHSSSIKGGSLLGVRAKPSHAIDIICDHCMCTCTCRCMCTCLSVWGCVSVHDSLLCECICGYLCPTASLFDRGMKHPHTHTHLLNISPQSNGLFHFSFAIAHIIHTHGHVRVNNTSIKVHKVN